MEKFGSKLDHFVDIVRQLRSEEGCPWDRQQTPSTLKRYLLEEAGEAIEAIDSTNDMHIRDELGDILYLLVLLSQIHAEAGSFDMGDVIDSISEKMIRRHPHVFGGENIATVEELRVKWKEIKAMEKGTCKNPKKD